MKKWQRSSGYLLMAYAMFLVYQSLQLSLGPPGQPGPGFLGFFLGLALGVCSIGLIFLNRGPEKCESGFTPKSFWEGEAWRKPLISLGALVLFVAIMGLIGAIPAMILFFLFWLRSLEKTGWTLAALVALIATGSFYLIFARFLQIPLPKGLLFI